VEFNDRDPLDPGTDYSNDEAYIDNIVHAWYDILADRLQVEYQDGTAIDLDTDSILKLAAAGGQEPGGGIFAGGLFFRNRLNGKIYPVYFTPTNIPNIVAAFKEIEKQMPQSIENLKQALIDVAISAQGVAQGVLRLQQVAAPSAVRLKASQVARNEFNENFRDEWAEQLGVGKGGEVHHARELVILDKYPNVYTQDELNAFENMRGIPAERVPSFHDGGLRIFWNEVYRRLDSKIVEEGLRPGTAEYNSTVRSIIDSKVFTFDQLFAEHYTK